MKKLKHQKGLTSNGASLRGALATKQSGNLGWIASSALPPRNDAPILRLSFLTIFILSVFVFCGFSLPQRQKPFILFCPLPINQDTISSATNMFKAGDKIYYMIYTPKGFQDDCIRIQLIKQDDKVPIGGYTVMYTQDVDVPLNATTYSNDITIPGKGIYIMQVAEMNNFRKALMYGSFRVEDPTESGFLH